MHWCELDRVKHQTCKEKKDRQQQKRRELGKSKSKKAGTERKAGRRVCYCTLRYSAPSMATGIWGDQRIRLHWSLHLGINASEPHHFSPAAQQSVSYTTSSGMTGVYCFRFASQIRYLSVRFNNPVMQAALMYSATGEDKRGNPKPSC